MPLIPISEAVATVADILAFAGAPPAHAALVAEHLLDAEACGYPSHGVNLVRSYVDQLVEGRIVASATTRVAQRRPGAFVIDGGGGFGQVAVRYGVEQLVPAARSQGAAIAVFRRIGHVGRLADYVDALARRGLLGVMTSAFALDPGEAIVAPVPGAPRLFGTNPLAFGFPGGRHPVVVDLATAASTVFGAVLARRKGQPLNAGTAVNSRGVPTTDPDELLNGGALLPMAGIKGAALSVATCLLGSLDSVSRRTDDGFATPVHGAAIGVDAGNVAGIGGTVLVAVDPGAFGPLDAFIESVEQLARSFDGTRLGFHVPGAKSHESRQRALRYGVSVDDAVWSEVVELAATLRRESGFASHVSDPMRGV